MSVRTELDSTFKHLHVLSVGMAADDLGCYTKIGVDDPPGVSFFVKRSFHADLVREMTWRQPWHTTNPLIPSS